MRETYRFRIYSEDAHIALDPEYLKDLRPVGKFDLLIAKGVVGDPLYRKLQEADQLLEQSSKTSLIAVSNIQRTYTSAEIEEAQLFLMHLFDAGGSGEEYGTWYTDGVQNDNCGVFERNKRIYNPKKTKRCALSSHQVGPLRFPFQKMRKGYDIFSLWGGELVISERLGKLIEAGGFTGGKVQPIWNTGILPKSMPNLSDVPSGAELLGRAKEKGFGPTDKVYWSWLEEDAQLPLLDKALWEQMELQQSRRPKTSTAGNFAQLTIQSPPLTVSERTLFGEKQFRPGSGDSCRCAFGEVRGGMLLSQLSVNGSSWDGSDICRSDVYVGSKAGLFRPWRHLVISKRLFDAMRREGMKGFDFEVVEMV
jgi:hypothetical protein